MPIFRNNTPKYVLWLILFLLLGYSVFNSIRHYDHSPYNDLRNRVVGARLMAADQSAYFHKWQNGEPETWLDPFEKQDQIVNGNTVTPATLAVFSWMNGMHYDTIKWVWVLFTFACFAISLFVIWKLLRLVPPLAGQPQPEFLLLLPAALLASAAWKLHLFSGQIYIIYALLLVLFFYLFTNQRFFVAGIIAVLLIVMRPPFMILFLPLFVWKLKRNMLFGTVNALLLFAILQVAKIPAGAWPDYFRSMNIHAQEIPGKIPLTPATAVIPPNPEGIYINNNEVDAYRNQLSPDILSVQKILPREGFLSETYTLPLLLCALYILLFLFTVKRKPLSTMSTANLLLSGFILYILSEYFLPAPRFTYNFVQWLFPLAVLVCSKQIQPGWRLWLLLAGLFLNIIKLPFIPDAYSVGELLMVAAVLGYIFGPEKTAENKLPATKFAAEP